MKKIARILLLIPFLAVACHQAADETTTKTERLLNVFYVRTAPIENAPLDDAVHVTGVVESDTEAKPSFKTGGVIAQTLVKEGNTVRKGQLLARLHLTEIEAQVNQARLGVDKAQRDLQRVQNLHADSIATLEQLQNATTALEMSQRSLQIAEFNLSYSEVRSPIAGKVVAQMLHPGEIAAPGMPVFYIMGVEASDWKIVAGLTDKNWGRIKKGDRAQITFDAYPGLTVIGQVERLSDIANPQSGTFNVEIRFPTNDKRIAAGLLAHVDIIPAIEKTFPTIPVEALVSSDGKTGIVYIPADGKASKRKIQIQQFQGERIAVHSGLENVNEVITAGSGFLEDGDAIVIEND